MLAVTALLSVGPVLYAGGSFSLCGLSGGGIAVSNIAAWDGAQWIAVGAGVAFQVTEMVVYNGALLVTSPYWWPGYNQLALWDGVAWTSGAAVLGLDGYAYAVAALPPDPPSALPPAPVAPPASNSTLLGDGSLGTQATFFVAGQFSQINGSSTAVHNVAFWSGDQWHDVGGGVNGVVSALHLHGGILYAGGDFNFAAPASAAPVRARSIAAWDGTQWRPVAAGLSGTVHAMTSFNGALIAAGALYEASGVTVVNIARWTGATWTRLGAGLPGPVVLALAVYQGDLVAGGNLAGGANVYRWVPAPSSSWEPLGSPLGGTVSALAECGGQLFAGGEFSSVASSPNVAVWNGTAWSPLRGGVNGAVSALACTADGTVLYVAGTFDVAGIATGVAANHVAA